MATTWNDQQTDAYFGMIAETVTIPGHNGDPIRAYYSRPIGDGPFPSLVLIPHMPGWDEWCWALPSMATGSFAPTFMSASATAPPPR